MTYTIEDSDSGLDGPISEVYTRKTEEEIYEAAMAVLEEHDIFAENHGLDNVDTKHWKNWKSKDKARHTLESAKALVDVACGGEFLDTITFTIRPTPGTFMLSYMLNRKLYMQSALTDEDIKKALAYPPPHSKHCWKWVAHDGTIHVNDTDVEESAMEEDGQNA